MLLFFSMNLAKFVRVPIYISIPCCIPRAAACRKYDVIIFTVIEPMNHFVIERYLPNRIMYYHAAAVVENGFVQGAQCCVFVE
jgi:hypothetical protein